MRKFLRPSFSDLALPFLSLTNHFSVLNPNNTMAMPNPTASTQSVAFSGASSASSAPFTSGISAPSTTVSSKATGASSIPSSAGAAQAIQTGVIGLGALFGGAALFAANI